MALSGPTLKSNILGYLSFGVFTFGYAQPACHISLFLDKLTDDVVDFTLGVQTESLSGSHFHSSFTHPSVTYTGLKDTIVSDLVATGSFSTSTTFGVFDLFLGAFTQAYTEWLDDGTSSVTNSGTGTSHTHTYIPNAASNLRTKIINYLPVPFNSAAVGLDNHLWLYKFIDDTSNGIYDHLNGAQLTTANFIHNFA